MKTEFTVTTRWESAGGKGKLAWPDGLRSTKFFSELQRLELEAREQRRGAWDEQRFPRSQAVSKSAVSKPSRVDLNDASVGELEALPGIGKTLAERIIAHRPYRRVNDLRKVKGIGDKTLEKLRPHIVVRPEEKGK
jgi:competence protein ComEA